MNFVAFQTEKKVLFRFKCVVTTRLPQFLKNNILEYEKRQENDLAEEKVLKAF